MPLFWKYDSPWPAHPDRPDHWVSYAIVHDHWKLVANTDLSHLELYDIASDVYEQHDLAPDQPETVTQLLQRLRDWQATLPPGPTGDVFSAER